jgi:hypothetical protein
MASSEDKKKRKDLLAQISGREKKDFEESLPISRQTFHNLFDFLDEKLVKCDDDLTLTDAFLMDNHISNISEVKLWLQEHGGYCDCEVLANVEEQFE